MKKLSLCITTYNRENDLVRCIKSAINQSMNNDDYEIIIVDDASTDRTQNVVEGLINQFPENEIKFVTLEENSGNASTPRNKAIDIAVGEYILFVDSDDYIAEETISNAYNYAKRNNSDALYLKYGLGSDFGNIPKAFSAQGSVAKADIIDNRLLFSLSVQKLFKLSEIKRLGLKFDPKVKIGEDMLFTVEFLFNTEVHSILADKEYYFLVHHNSDRLTSTHVPLKKSFDNYHRILKLINEGSYANEEYRERASARFIHRTLLAGRGSNKYYLRPGCNAQKVDEFYTEFKSLLENGFPVEREKFLSQQYKDEVFALRKGEMLGHRFAIDIYELKNRTSQMEKKITDLSNRNKDLESQIITLKDQMDLLMNGIV